MHGLDTYRPWLACFDALGRCWCPCLVATIELQELVLENPTLGSNFSCRALPSLDGKNASSQVVPYELYKSTNIVKYLFDGAVGENVSVVLKGAFNLVTFVVTASLNGRY